MQGAKSGDMGPKGENIPHPETWLSKRSRSCPQDDGRNKSISKSLDINRVSSSSNVDWRRRSSLFKDGGTTAAKEGWGIGAGEEGEEEIDEAQSKNPHAARGFTPEETFARCFPRKTIAPT